MLWSQRGINWNDLPIECKRGVCYYHISRSTTMQDPRNPGNTIEVERRVWVIDKEPPIFTQDRLYIEKWL